MGTSCIEPLSGLANQHGRYRLILTMGKGGVGKTTLVVAIAVELARQGHSVELTTTDPAAHLDAVLAAGDSGSGSLQVSRIDPDRVTAAYVAEVLADAGAGLETAAAAGLEEDLRSPCTAEIAVFRAFARTVAGAPDLRDTSAMEWPRALRACHGRHHGDRVEDVNQDR